MVVLDVFVVVVAVVIAVVVLVVVVAVVGIGLVNRGGCYDWELPSLLWCFLLRSLLRLMVVACFFSASLPPGARLAIRRPHPSNRGSASPSRGVKHDLPYSPPFHDSPSLGNHRRAIKNSSWSPTTASGMSRNVFISRERRYVGSTFWPKKTRQKSD